MYTPKKQRKFGYYVLPILHKGYLIGRLEPKLERDSKTLIIKNILFESKSYLIDNTIYCIAKTIIEFAQFLNASNIKILKSHPTQISQRLNEIIKTKGFG